MMSVPSLSSHRRVRSSSSASHCSRLSKPRGRCASSDTAHLLPDGTRIVADYAQWRPHPSLADPIDNRCAPRTDVRQSNRLPRVALSPSCLSAHRRMDAFRRAGLGVAHRWPCRLHPSGRREVRPRAGQSQRLRRARTRGTTRCAPGRLAAQTMGRRDAAPRAEPAAPRLLPRRVRLPLQPANATERGLLFYRLIQQALATDPHPLRELIDGPTPEIPEKPDI